MTSALTHSSGCGQGGQLDVPAGGGCTWERRGRFLHHRGHQGGLPMMFLLEVAARGSDEGGFCTIVAIREAKTEVISKS